MHKKLWALVIVTAMLTVLTGCMQPQSGSNQSSSEGQTQSGSLSNPFGNYQNTQPEEPETMELAVTADGVVKKVPATVYTGSGYSIAIPDEWIREDNEPQWNPPSNDDVELTIRFYSGKKVDEAQAAFMRDKDDYTYEAARKSSLANLSGVTELRGTETDDDEQTKEDVIVYFAETESGCYGIVLECPVNATESYGGYLGAMADTFTLLTKE